MNCSFCTAENADDNAFCVSCGKAIAPPKNAAADDLPATEFFRGDLLKPTITAPESVQTMFRPKAATSQSEPIFNQSIPFENAPPIKKRGALIWFAIGLVLLILIGGGGISSYYLVKNQDSVAPTVENLPDHLGMFVKNTDGKMSELARQDFNALAEAKKDLMQNDALTATDDAPDLFLYADSKEVPLGDLKLIPIDSMQNDGTAKQLGFQAAPVADKPDIKRLRVPGGLANGRYAFALFEGFADEGRHKFWSFEVKNSAQKAVGEASKPFSVALKPKSAEIASNSNAAANVVSAATVKSAPPVPAGAQVAYCKSSNVVMRNSPRLNAKKINALKRGQKIYIINYSENYDYWNGTEGNWAYVQTEEGSRGWVFSPLIGGE